MKRLWRQDTFEGSFRIRFKGTPIVFSTDQALVTKGGGEVARFRLLHIGPFVFGVSYAENT